MYKILSINLENPSFQPLTRMQKNVMDNLFPSRLMATFFQSNAWEDRRPRRYTISFQSANQIEIIFDENEAGFVVDPTIIRVMILACLL